MLTGLFANKFEGVPTHSCDPNGLRSFESPKKSRIDYNLDMALAILGMRILTWMFFVGLAGSAVVVLISFWEDGKELFGKD
jgi:hypothetical protein